MKLKVEVKCGKCGSKELWSFDTDNLAQTKDPICVYFECDECGNTYTTLISELEKD